MKISTAGLGQGYCKSTFLAEVSGEKGVQKMGKRHHYLCLSELVSPLTAAYPHSLFSLVKKSA